MKKYTSSILVIILCFAGAYKYLFPSNCYGLAEGLWLILFVSILVLYLFFLVGFNIFQKIKNNRNPNFKPFLAFVFGILVIVLLAFIQSEYFKSKRILTAKSIWQELILRKNNSYELIHRLPEFTCKEEGRYTISNDTIYLFENPKINLTKFCNEKYTIDSKLNELKPIVNDIIDNENILKIE